MLLSKNIATIKNLSHFINDYLNFCKLFNNCTKYLLIITETMNICWYYEYLLILWNFLIVAILKAQTKFKVKIFKLCSFLFRRLLRFLISVFSDTYTYLRWYVSSSFRFFYCPIIVILFAKFYNNPFNTLRKQFTRIQITATQLVRLGKSYNFNSATLI